MGQEAGWGQGYGGGGTANGMGRPVVVILTFK